MNTISKQRIEKLLSFVLCFAMLLSMGTSAFAEGTACEHNNYAEEITTAATCTGEGLKTFTCNEAGCGAVWTAAIAATGHSNVDGICSTCGATVSAPQPEECTGDESCTAEGESVVHSGSCPKAAPAPQPEECTGDESCTAEGESVVHSGSCPKAAVILAECSCVAKCAANNDACELCKNDFSQCAGECTGLADCTASEHVTACLSYCTGLADCTATAHVEGCLSTICTCTDKCSANTEACPVCDDSTDLPNECKGRKLPKPTVTDLGPTNIAGRDMQCTALYLSNEDYDQAVQNGYGDWITEFYLSFSGFTGSIIADGCAIGGIIGPSWERAEYINGLEIIAGEQYPMVYALGGGSVVIDWKTVCSVGQFTAGIYVNPDLLTQYPDFKATLVLRITAPDNSAHKDLLTIAYDVDDLLGSGNPKAKITNSNGTEEFASLEDAIEKSVSGDVITLLDDAIINSPLTLKAGTSLLPDGNLLTGTLNSSIVLKSGDAIYGYYTVLDSAIADANKLSGELVVEIYDKVNYASSTPNLGSSYSKISFVGKDGDAEICITRNGPDGYISGTGSAPAVSFSDLVLSKSAGGHAADAAFMNCCFTVYRVSSVTYSGCSFPNGACAAGCPTSYSGCTIGTSYDKYGMWFYGNTSVTVDGCTFTGNRGIKLYAAGAARTNNLTLRNSDLSGCTGKPAIVLTYAASVTLSGNSYPDTGVFELDKDGAPNGTAVTADIDDIACMNDDYADCGVLMNGKIYIDLEAAIAAEGEGENITLFYEPANNISIAEKVVIEDNGNEPSGTITLSSTAASLTAVEGLNVVSGVSGYSVIYRNGTYSLVCYVAETGGVQYESLAAAIEAAADGAAVKLLKDNSENVEIDRNITFDTNGMQYTGAASVASGTTLTISEEDLAALSAGLTLADSYGDVSVGGKLIGLSDGNLSASGGVLTITPDAGSATFSYIVYNGVLIGVPFGSPVTVAADGSAAIPAGGSVVFAYNFEVPVDAAASLSADGVLSWIPAEVEDYGYGRAYITYGEGNKTDTVFVPEGASLSVSADASGNPVYTSNSAEKPIVIKSLVEKPTLTISPSRKAFYKYGLGTVTFTCNGFSSTLVSVSVDNVALNSSAAEVKAGSTVVKLSNAYLRSLSLGQHTLKLSYADGQSITATISVVETPVTGDNNQLAGFAFLMAGFSGSALALLYLLKKRRA